MANLSQAVMVALREGLGRFELPPDTTSSQLAAGLPPLVAAREYRRKEDVHYLSMPERNARPGTLSAVHGWKPFPPHVDGAHLESPPRLVVLWCAADDERRPTLLYRWSDVEAMVERNLIEREVFEYRSGRSSRVSTIVSGDREYVRYDPGCMRPATKRASDLLKLIGTILTDQPPRMIQWVAGDGVVIDNWSMLHARGTPENSGSRQLLRMWLDLKENAA